MTEFPAESQNVPIESESTADKNTLSSDKGYAALEQRVIDLESQLAFQEDTISELNRLVAKQSDELQRIQKHIMIMAERVQQIPESSAPSSADERPPHY
ncbi:SlyX family protein [Aliidiomarina sp.]|uniref:SlyX family protein n=1 Tax=Aliidiomarina sp. TaxID=1872439 RepID=UPI003A4E35C7